MGLEAGVAGCEDLEVVVELCSAVTVSGLGVEGDVIGFDVVLPKPFCSASSISMLVVFASVFGAGDLDLVVSFLSCTGVAGTGTIAGVVVPLALAGVEGFNVLDPSGGTRRGTGVRGVPAGRGVAGGLGVGGARRCTSGSRSGAPSGGGPSPSTST